MNWIINKDRPKIKKETENKTKDIPDNLWTVCKGCKKLIYNKELKENLYVCPNCDYHMQLNPKQRFELLFDGEYKELEFPKVKEDPLGFVDSIPYTERLKKYRNKTGKPGAMEAAIGNINNVKTLVNILNFGFMGGSMGTYVGEAFLTSAQKAIEEKTPFVAVTASGGARMQESILSLMQLPRTSLAVKMLKENHIPYIVLITHPTSGGVSASYAMLGDINIAEKNAMIAFAGRRVIEQTIKQKLPDDFQTAEFSHKHGMVDAVLHRKDLKEKLGILLKHLSKAQNKR